MKPSEILLEFLRNSKSEISNIYYRLFSLKEPDKLDEELEYLLLLSEGKDDYFKEYGKTDWFAIWHKSIRQTDYFEDCYINRRKPLLTPDEEKQFKFLNHKVKKQGYNKYDEAGKIFNDEYRYYLDLWEKRRRENIQDSICGVLDSVLWNTIHIDKENILYNIFKRTFDDMNYYKEQKDKVLQQSLDNMRGGCAHNFDGTDRKPGDYTDIEANIQHWVERYGEQPPQDVINHWKNLK